MLAKDRFCSDALRSTLLLKRLGSSNEIPLFLFLIAKPLNLRLFLAASWTEAAFDAVLFMTTTGSFYSTFFFLLVLVAGVFEGERARDVLPPLLLLTVAALSLI